MVKQVWSSKSLGSRLQHVFFYKLLQFGGLTASKFILFFVVSYYTLVPSVRNRIVPYLNHIFGPTSWRKRIRQIFKLYWQFGQILLERAAAGILGNMESKGSDEEERGLVEIAEQNKGLILMTAHVGSWQTGFSGLDFMGRPVHIMLYKSREDIDKHYFEHKKDDSVNMNFIDPAGPFGGMIEARSALMRGEVICIMGDRLAERENLAVPVTFLGETIKIPGTAYILASITGSPLCAVFTIRQAACKSKGVNAGFIKVPTKLPRNAKAIQPYAQEFADKLENIVRQYPYQFFNFYDIWASENINNKNNGGSVL